MTPARKLIRFDRDSIIFGLQMALSGLLALWTALVLQLQNPGWSVLTVLILGMAKYTGAIAEKALMRMVGTVVGGMIGLLIAGNLMSSPLLLLLCTFVVISYSVYRYGGSQVPYAWFLCALTTLVVVSGSLDKPDSSWQVALARTMEVGIGVLSTSLVTSVFFPLRAREVFLRRLRSTLRESAPLLDLLRRKTEGTIHSEEVLKNASISLLGGLEKLPGLLHFCSRESRYFKAREHLFQELISQFLQLVSSLQDSARSDFPSGLASYFAGPVRELIDALENEIHSMAKPFRALPDSGVRLEKALLRVHSTLHTFREQHLGAKLSGRDFLDGYSYLLGLVQACEALQKIRKIEAALPSVETREYYRVPREKKQSPPINAFWVHNGIKGGLAACAALVFSDWLQPPGMIAIPLVAWVYVVTSRSYPGGQGDRRSFQSAFWVAVAGVPVTAAVIMIWPALSSPVSMAFFIAFYLCTFGVLSFNIPGMTYTMQPAILGISSIISMNPQEVVPFSSMVSFYFGIVSGIFLGATVQRLFWPVLPQCELRTRAVEFYQHLGKLLADGSESREEDRRRLPMILEEMIPWARVMTTPDVPRGESERLEENINSMRRVSRQVVLIEPLQHVQWHPALQRFETALAPLKSSMRSAALALESAWREGSVALLVDMAPSQAVEDAVEQIRDDGSGRDVPDEEMLEALGVMCRWERSFLALNRLVEETREISLPALCGDHAL